MQNFLTEKLTCFVIQVTVKMAERHYLPKSCCLVFSVRTGATILAIMGIIGSGMNLASDSYGLAVIAPQIENYIDEYRIRSYEEFAGMQIYFA